MPGYRAYVAAEMRLYPCISHSLEPLLSLNTSVASIQHSLRSPDQKLYILDTNVLIHDPTALVQFKEHSLCLPLVVLEELDKHKNGHTETARSARQATRTLAELLQFGGIDSGFDLGKFSNERATGTLFFHRPDKAQAPAPDFALEKADNQILACAAYYQRQKLPAVLVTKDVNLRVKALALGIKAQDYRSDRVLLSDEDLLPSGYVTLTEDFWEFSLARDAGASPFWHASGKNHARTTQVLPLNSFVHETRTGGRSRIWRVVACDENGATLVEVARKSGAKSEAILTPRNELQEMACNLLTDETIDVVSLLGVAGTGKTLLAVAEGLSQVRQGRFKSVLITRATVALGDDIGFLPGTEAEKMDAWLGGTLRDVYEALNLGEAKDLQRTVEVASMSFMRGRSFQDKYIVIDEAQNLTTHQTKSLLTRAGAGCKVVLTGNLSQIDTPYLDEGSSGLAWAVKTLQNWKHSGHLILIRGERSRLASYIEEAAHD